MSCQSRHRNPSSLESVLAGLNSRGNTPPRLDPNTGTAWVQFPEHRERVEQEKTMSTRRVTRAASSRASSVVASDIGSEVTVTRRTPRRSGRNLPPVNPRESTSYGSSTAVVASEIDRRGHERDLTETLAEILGPAYQNHENRENHPAEGIENESQIGLRSGRGPGSRVGESRAGIKAASILATPGNNDNSNSFGQESSIFGHLNSNQASPGRGITGISPIQEIPEPVDNSQFIIPEPPRFRSTIDDIRAMEQHVHVPSFWRKAVASIRAMFQLALAVFWGIIQWLLTPFRLFSILVIIGFITSAFIGSGGFTRPFGVDIQNTINKFCLGYISHPPESFSAIEISALQRRMANLEHDIASFKIPKPLKLDETAARKLAPLVRKYQLEQEQNIAKTLRRVNHFSVKNGAIVNPYTTSPSYQFSKQRANLFWRALHWVAMDPLPSPKPPVEALSNWEESGDCWCSPVQGSGSGVRLGVLLPNNIYPDEIVIEHVPQSATLDPGATPEKMELFAKIEGDDGGRIRDDSSLIFANAPYEKHLDETYVRIAEWDYNADASNNIQVFPIQIDLKRYGVSTRELVVGALNNSGNADHTCLYRIRLHGQVHN